MNFSCYEFEIREIISQLNDIQQEVSSSHSKQWLITNITVFITLVVGYLNGLIDLLKEFENA